MRLGCITTSIWSQVCIAWFCYWECETQSKHLEIFPARSSAIRDSTSVDQSGSILKQRDLTKVLDKKSLPAICRHDNMLGLFFVLPGATFRYYEGRSTYCKRQCLGRGLLCFDILEVHLQRNGIQLVGTMMLSRQ